MSPAASTVTLELGVIVNVFAELWPGLPAESLCSARAV
jgi:hypothetical protein